MLRIIAGQWRGRTLVAPPGQATRPTAARAREALFSMLASRLGGFTGCRVADLFAGSGALGFEALSRGAVSAIFVDSDAAAIAAIRTNATVLGAAADIRAAKVTALGPAPESVDILFIDPPYGTVDVSSLLTMLTEKHWIRPETMVSVETGAGTSLPAPAFDTVAVRRVGRAQLHLLRLA